MGLFVLAPAHLNGHRRVGVFTDVHQGTEPQVGHNESLGKYGYQGIVLAVHVRTNTKGRARPRGIVHIDDGLRMMHAQDLEDLFCQLALLIRKGRSKTTVEIPDTG